MQPINKFFKIFQSAPKKVPSRPKTQSNSGSFFQNAMTSLRRSPAASAKREDISAWNKNSAYSIDSEEIVSKVKDKGKEKADSEVSEQKSSKEATSKQRSTRINEISEFHLIAEGAAKAVHVRKGDKKKRVFLSPKRNAIRFLTLLRRKELREEFAKVKAMQHKLILSKLSNLDLSPKEEKLIFKLVSNKKYSLEKLTKMTPKNLNKKLKLNSKGAQGLTILMQKLNDENIDLSKIGENLAFNLREAKDADKVGGDYTLITSKGKNLEKVLRKRDFKLEQKFELGRQLINGLRDLHEIGYTHGDLKLDNILIFRKKDGSLQLKITDFGKTGSKVFKTGNPRFAGLEGISSHQEEAYTCGMMLIALFEKSFLTDNQDMLVDIEQNKMDHGVRLEGTPENPRQGIEKFVILHKDFPQTEAKKLKGKIKVYSRRLSQTIKHKFSLKDKKDYTYSQIAIQEYEDALGDHLKNKNPRAKDRIDRFIAIVKDLTLSDPSQRLSLWQVAERYQEIV